MYYTHTWLIALIDSTFTTEYATSPGCIRKKRL